MLLCTSMRVHKKITRSFKPLPGENLSERISKGDLLDTFIAELAGCRSRRELREFLQAILTPAEIKELPVRLEIIRLLKQGHSQREVAQALGVGIATVSRGARELKLGSFKNVCSNT